MTQLQIDIFRDEGGVKNIENDTLKFGCHLPKSCSSVSISHLTSVWVLLGKTFLVYFHFFLVYFIHQGTILLLSHKCYFCKAIETTILLYDWFYNFVYCSKLFCFLQSLCVWLTVSLKLCEWGSLYYSKL